MTATDLQSLQVEYAALDSRKELLHSFLTLNPQEKGEMADILKRQKVIGQMVFKGDE